MIMIISVPEPRMPLLGRRDRQAARQIVRCETGVCEKTLLRIRRREGKLASRTPNRGLERSFCRCVAGQRLAQKECFFHRHWEWSASALNVGSYRQPGRPFGAQLPKRIYNPPEKRCLMFDACDLLIFIAAQPYALVEVSLKGVRLCGIGAGHTHPKHQTLFMRVVGGERHTHDRESKTLIQIY